MSKKLSIRMYLRHQKKNAEGKVPIYVHVTIDGDDEDFSLSRRIDPSFFAKCGDPVQVVDVPRQKNPDSGCN